MSRTKYSVSFPSKRAGAEITWPNMVLVFPDRDAHQPLQEAYLENPSSPVLLWSESASVPFSCEGETLTCTTGAPTQTGADAAAGGGGGASEHLGDYMLFARSDGPDGDTGSFDWASGDDLQASSGTTIALDDSDAWLTGAADWGFPVPQVTEDGVYAVTWGLHNDAPAILGLGFYDPTGGSPSGAAVTDASSNAIAGQIAHSAVGVDVGGGTVYQGRASFVGKLAAGTHIDMSASGIDTFFLSIERVG